MGVLLAGLVVEPLAAVRNSSGVLRLQCELPESGAGAGRLGWVSETASDGTKLLERVE
eukprot:SAG11_NODE_205_length_12427_cov_8.010140_2_plen_58_part_00